MTSMSRGIIGIIVVACAVYASAQSAVSIHFDAGFVTLSARNAPLGVILAEWARVGGSRIVNAEHVTGPPLTLELTAVRERDAFDILLRSVSGYLLTERSEPVARRSAIDRVVILPASFSLRGAPSADRPPPPAPSAGVVLFGDPLVGYGPDDLDLERLQRQLRAREAIERAVRGEALDGNQAVDAPAPRGPTLPFGPFGHVSAATRPGELVPASLPDAPPNPPRPTGVSER